jgi:hypothetical protein
MALANGDRITSSGCYLNLKVAIVGEVFSIDCYELTLGS